MTDKSGSEWEDKGTYILHGRLMEALINHHIHF